MIRLTLLLFAFLPLLSSAQQGGWELRYDKDQIQILYRKSQHSPINELKLITELHTDMPTLLEFLSDIDHFPIWVFRCAEARQVKSESPAKSVYYSRMDFPWPLRDRDFFARSNVEFFDQGRRVEIRVTGVPEYASEVQQVVRIPYLQARWTLRQLSAGRIQIEYYLHADPGGSLPDWLINMAVDKGPSETMYNLRRTLNQYTEDRRQENGRMVLRGE